MKKLFLIICAVIFANATFAQTEIFKIGNLSYEITAINEVSMYDCEDTVTELIIPETIAYNGVDYTVTSIGRLAFYGCEHLRAVTIPSTVHSIGYLAFERCFNLVSVTCLAVNPPQLFGVDPFHATQSNKVLTIPFGSNYSAWVVLHDKWGKTNYLIQEGERKVLSNRFTIDNRTGLINEGVLRITQNGELVNTTQKNVPGIFEIETPVLPNDRWAFVGAPFTDYKLEVVIPGTRDVSVSKFDYTTGDWSEEWAYEQDNVEAGEGFFMWSFVEEKTVFTTYGNGKDTYDYSLTPKYALNHGGVRFDRVVTTNAEGGNYMALCNPYPFKLDIAEVIAGQEEVKGAVAYRFDGMAWDAVESGALNMTEGFFLNFENPGFHSTYMVRNYRYGRNGNKAEVKKDYIKLVMNDGERESKLMFAQNDKARQGDDKYDANKLFSPFEIAEPYFVTDGVALVKEEVKRLPYASNLNVRSYDSRNVTFRVENIPAGVDVYLLDNGEEVKMNGGVEYSANVVAGENADRFKLYVKKAHQNLEGTNNEIDIYNLNREVNIETSLNDLYVEVYNVLGKRVFETRDYNFTLSDLPAGTYMVKVYNRLALETTKIVIE
ncbi:MAG: leucine-rich repeat protein [Bacteroidales bacterium]|nr:leucine-rich repeat protein [Bacteroidales bacterium]